MNKEIYSFKTPVVIDLDEFFRTNSPKIELLGRNEQNKEVVILKITKIKGTTKVKISDNLNDYIEEIDPSKRNILVLSIFYNDYTESFDELFIDYYRLFKFNSFPEFENCILVEPNFEFTPGTTCDLCEEGCYEEADCECEVSTINVSLMFHVPLTEEKLNESELKECIAENNLAVIMDPYLNDWAILTPKGIHKNNLEIIRKVFKFADKERIVCDGDVSILDQFKLGYDLNLKIHYRYLTKEDSPIIIEIVFDPDVSIRIKDSSLFEEYIDPKIMYDMAEFNKLVKNSDSEFEKVLLDRSYLIFKEIKKFLPEEVVYLILDAPSLFIRDFISAELSVARTMEVHLLEQKEYESTELLTDFDEIEEKVIIKLKDYRVDGITKFVITDETVISILAENVHNMLWVNLKDLI